MRRMQVVLRATTLVEAGRWAAAAWVGWTFAWIVTGVLNVAREGIADQIWYAVAVLVVAPFAAVLGARRPGSRVWSWFVVLPATIVLLLPAATAWSHDWSVGPLRLELPMLAGYSLVLVMGLGNYLGTRFAWDALLAATACLVIVVPMSTLGSRISASPQITRAAATLLAVLALRRAARWNPPASAPRQTRFDVVWIDFRDLFGVVWARRILERVNDTARSENWPVRLHLDGFTPTDPSRPLELTSEQQAQIEQTLRWLLRRFVDREWFDARFGGATAPPGPPQEHRPSPSE